MTAIEHASRAFKSTPELTKVPSIKEYWKQRLCDKLSQDVYIFPVDENSKREFYDTISNDKIVVFGKDKFPSNRGIRAEKEMNIGTCVMEVSAFSAYFEEPEEEEEMEEAGRGSRSTSKGSNRNGVGSHNTTKYTTTATRNKRRRLPYQNFYEEILLPYVDFSGLHRVESELVHLTMITLFNYLENSEFACLVNNLCTHQRQIRADGEMAKNRDRIKCVIVEMFIAYFNDFIPAMAAFKRGEVRIAKSSWKFLENLINLVFINYSTLMNYKFEAVGYNLDPQFAIINHSCLPNCIQIETPPPPPNNNNNNSSGGLGCGGSLGGGGGCEKNGEFKLINSLPIKPNDEITVTYINTAMPTEIRQYQLFKRYYFRCTCQLCTSKTDVFFTMQCFSCFKPVKSPSLSGVLNAPNTIPKESTCSHCFHELDVDLYKRQVQIRNFFMALILNPSSSYNLPNEGYFSLLQKEFIGLVERTGNSALIKMLDQAVENFQLPTGIIDFVKSLIDEIMQKKVFQLCAFPFNVIVRSILATCEKRDFASGMEFLKYYSREMFAVNFPADLSNQLFFNECLYLELANSIMEVMDHLKEEKIATCFGAYSDSLELLARCAYFFYKHVTSKNELEQVEEKLGEIRDEYPKIKSTLSLHSCLEKFFIHANANIYITTTRLLIFNAKQEQVTLFHTFDTDDFL
ncbi:uncharacterized protein LODBEIA_P17650 [Lodderomyces beijingensis]|uniref:SET domain-containing protein n=1 Tax=Lodderomyces beijingensis TaxID=1775926 RepID=A0ABP0ZHA0_9ASCO